MALIPVENVGETGIVKDINPWQPPIPEPEEGLHHWNEETQSWDVVSKP